MSTPKGFLFDFNGTLFHDSAMHIAAFRQIIPKYGKPAPSDDEIIRHIFGLNNETIYRRLFGDGHSPEQIAAFSRDKETIYRECCLAMPEKMHLIQGAEALLDYLKAHNIPYCLATGSGLDNIEFYYQYLSLDRWFHRRNIVYDDGSCPGKPAPDIYRVAAGRIGLSPEECIVFEDGTSGIRSAKAAGAGKIVAMWEKGFPSPLTDGLEVDFILHDLENWKEFLHMLGVIPDEKNPA